MAIGSLNSKSSKLKLAIVDYGMGNVRSVQCALERLGCKAFISSDTKILADANAYILPGVGAFGKAMENLTSRGLISVLNEQILKNKKPILGICLGMQLFADSSTEMGNHKGLGWIPGTVDLIDTNLSLPHVGWNNLSEMKSPDLFKRVEDKSHFYFDHSYHFKCAPQFVLSTAHYGGSVVSAVKKDNIFGVQFHPEKSQTAGLKLLRNFLNFSAELSC